MKVNIIGHAHGWQVAPNNGICWGINTHIMKRPYSVLFDMHDIEGELSGSRHADWGLSKHKHDESVNHCLENDVTVFSLGAIEGTTIIEYPLEKICKYFKKNYFTCGVAYAIAMAIYQGATQIDIWGTYLRIGGEHEYERPCIEYWIGRAEGLGIDVNVHGMSTLLICPKSVLYGYNTKQVGVRFNEQL
jgi:hypothetical protein